MIPDRKVPGDDPTRAGALEPAASPPAGPAPAPPLGASAPLPPAAVRPPARPNPSEDNPTWWVRSQLHGNDQVTAVTIRAVGEPQGYPGGTPPKNMFMGFLECSVTILHDDGTSEEKTSPPLKYFTQMEIPPAHDAVAVQEKRLHHDTLVKAYCYFHEVASNPSHLDPKGAAIRAKVDQIVANGAISVKVDLEKLKKADLSGVHKITWMNERDDTLSLDYRETALKASACGQRVLKGAVGPAPALAPGHNPVMANLVRDGDIHMIDPPRIHTPSSDTLHELKAKQNLSFDDFAESEPAPALGALPSEKTKLEDYLTFAASEMDRDRQNFAMVQERVLQPNVTVEEPKWYQRLNPRFSPQKTTSLGPKSNFQSFMSQYAELDRLLANPHPSPEEIQLRDALQAKLKKEDDEQMFTGALPVMQHLATQKQHQIAQLKAVKASGDFVDNLPLLEKLNTLITEGETSLARQMEAINVLTKAITPQYSQIAAEFTQKLGAIDALNTAIATDYQRINQLRANLFQSAGNMQHLISGTSPEVAHVLLERLYPQYKALYDEYYSAVDQHEGKILAVGPEIDRARTYLENNSGHLLPDAFEGFKGELDAKPMPHEKPLSAYDEHINLIKSMVQASPKSAHLFTAAEIGGRVSENEYAPTPAGLPYSESVGSARIQKLSKDANVLANINYGEIRSASDYSTYYEMVEHQGLNINAISPDTLLPDENTQFNLLNDQHVRLSQAVFSSNGLDQRILEEVESSLTTDPVKIECALNRLLFLFWTQDDYQQYEPRINEFLSRFSGMIPGILAKGPSNMLPRYLDPATNPFRTSALPALPSLTPPSTSGLSTPASAATSFSSTPAPASMTVTAAPHGAVWTDADRLKLPKGRPTPLPRATRPTSASSAIDLRGAPLPTAASGASAPSTTAAPPIPASPAFVAPPGSSNQTQTLMPRAKILNDFNYEAPHTAEKYGEYYESIYQQDVNVFAFENKIPKEEFNKLKAQLFNIRDAVLRGNTSDQAIFDKVRTGKNDPTITDMERKCALNRALFLRQYSSKEKAEQFEPIIAEMISHLPDSLKAKMSVQNTLFSRYQKSHPQHLKAAAPSMSTPSSSSSSSSSATTTAIPTPASASVAATASPQSVKADPVAKERARLMKGLEVLGRTKQKIEDRYKACNATLQTLKQHGGEINTLLAANKVPLARQKYTEYMQAFINHQLAINKLEEKKALLANDAADVLGMIDQSSLPEEETDNILRAVNVINKAAAKMAPNRGFIEHTNLRTAFHLKAGSNAPSTEYDQPAMRITNQYLEKKPEKKLIWKPSPPSSPRPLPPSHSSPPQLATATNVRENELIRAMTALNALGKTDSNQGIISRANELNNFVTKERINSDYKTVYERIYTFSHEVNNLSEDDGLRSALVAVHKELYKTAMSVMPEAFNDAIYKLSPLPNDANTLEKILHQALFRYLYMIDNKQLFETTFLRQIIAIIDALTILKPAAVDPNTFPLLKAFRDHQIPPT